MKKNLFNSIKIIAIAAVLAVGVSYVSAYTSPGAPTPAGSPTNNVPAPINIGALVQTKIGSLTTESFLKSGSNVTPGTTGWIIAANAAGATDNGGIASLWQFFQKEYLPGTKSQMKVGSPNPGRTTTPLPSVNKTEFNPKDTSIPLTIDLIDRGTGNNSVDGTQVMDLLAGDVCNNATTVQTNTAGVQFWSTLNNSNADVIARGIQLGDSSAGAMKVLVATDTSGNAVWGTMRIANGQVIVDYPGSSDVAAGQACGVAPAITYSWSSGNWGACTDFNGTDWRNYYHSSGSLNGSVGESCTNFINRGATNNGTQTRDVVCKDSTGATVADSFCTGIKPDTSKTCTVSAEYRALLQTDPGQTTSYSSTGTCLYAKYNNVQTLFADDCLSLSMTAPAPAGYVPTSYCTQLVVAGSGVFNPGYGFNAGPGNSNGNNISVTVTSFTKQLQVKTR